MTKQKRSEAILSRSLHEYIKIDEFRDIRLGEKPDVPEAQFQENVFVVEKYLDFASFQEVHVDFM